MLLHSLETQPKASSSWRCGLSRQNNCTWDLQHLSARHAARYTASHISASHGDSEENQDFSLRKAHLPSGLAGPLPRGERREGLSGGLTSHRAPGGGLIGSSLGSRKGGSCRTQEMSKGLSGRLLALCTLFTVRVG